MGHEPSQKVPSRALALTDSKLAGRQADELLQHAIELHHADKTSLSVAEMEHIAAELGLPKSAIEVAYRDLAVRAIVLEKTDAPILQRLLGAAHATVTRRISGLSKQELDKRLRTYFEGQLFRVTRAQGNHITFQAHDRPADSLRRAVDLQKRFELTSSAQLDAVLSDVDGGTEVTLIASFAGTRREAAWAGAIGSTMAGLAGATVGVLFTPIAYPVAGLLALGALALGRSSLRSEIEKTRRSLAYLLDQLEQGEPAAVA